MKAVVLHKRGSPDQLQYQDWPEPEIGPDEVLVRVRACATNYLDVWTRSGAQGVKAPLPHILGIESAGDVAAMGPEVHGLELGQPVVVAPFTHCDRCKYCLSGHDNMCVDRRIIGVQLPGGYAEYVKAPARNIIPIPIRIPYETVAAIPVAFGTAWHMLASRAHARAGETVLVLAAGSGVGTAAIQIAKLLGCRVIATASTDAKLALARELGADEVINYREQPKFSVPVRKLTDGRGVDIVFEHVGTDSWEQSIASLAVNGRLVTCGSTTGRWGNTDLLSVFGKQLSLLGSFGAATPDFKIVAQLVIEGKIRPVIDRVFPLAEAAEAHRLLEARQVFGKFILVP